MGIAPLDWADGMPWGTQMRKLGEGTPAERAQVKPRGLFEFGAMPGIPEHTATMMAIVMEHSVLGGALATNDGGAAQNAAASCIEWMRAGTQIFDFERDLMRELSETDVDDVQASEIEMPYEAFYLRFGGSVVDGMDRPLDGLLVERRSTDTPMIGITPFRRHAGRVVVDSMCVLPLEGDATVVEAIESEIRRTSDVRSGRSIVDGVEMSNSVLTSGFLGEVGSGVASGFAAMNGSAKRLKAILPLVVNALLYIDGCRSHIARGWPQGAPDKLAAKALKAVRGETRARDTLLRGNWREVHVCTLETEERAGASVGARVGRDDHAGPRPHFRRAHWRRQPHGPANSLRRRIRIRATIVGNGAVAPKGPRSYNVRERAA